MIEIIGIKRISDFQTLLIFDDFKFENQIGSTDYQKLYKGSNNLSYKQRFYHAV